MSIVLADDPKDTTMEGKMKVIVEALALADKGGITKPLIDTAIPAFEPDMGTAVRTIPIMKEKYGHPVGLGSGNVVTTMGWVKANVAKEFRPGCRTATNSIMQMAGANWLMIGPAEQAEWVTARPLTSSTLSLQRVNLERFGGTLRGDRLGARLYNIKAAILAILRPFDVHRHRVTGAG